SACSRRPGSRAPDRRADSRAATVRAGASMSISTGDARGGISLRLIRELPADERPRERLALRGAAGLTSAELIGLLWGSGGRGRSAVDLAVEAIARFDSLTGLARASGPELEAVPGVGAARAA